MRTRMFFGFIATCLSSIALASNSGVTYQGRILKPDGSPLAGQFTQFRMQLRTPDSSGCLMYEELQSQDLRNSNGAFSVTINDGTGSRSDTTGLTLDRIFANHGTFTLDPSTCNTGSGAYSPAPGDGRNLVVLFKDETMSTWEPVPPQKINFVPLAFESKQVGGFTADSLLRVVNGSGDPLSGLTPLSNAQYTALMALVNGSSTTYAKAGELNGVALPAMTTGEALGWNGTAWVSTPTGTPGTNSITAAMLQASSVTGTKLDPAISILTSGTVASAITTTRDFKIYATSPSTFYVRMLAPAALGTSYSLTWPMTAGASNQVLTTDGSGNLTWTTPSSAGITALTGDVTASGPGSAAATVTSVGTSTAAQVHAAELAANAATSAATASTIVKRDGSGDFVANVGKFNGLALNNGVSLLNIVNPPGGAYTLTLPANAGSNGQILSTNGAGVTSWTAAPAATQWTTQAPGINYTGGNVGIGTTAPGSGTALSVEGQIRTKSFTTTSGALNFANGNTIITSFDCGANITLANLRDGGSYSVIVTGTGTTQCTFDTAATGDDAGTVAYRFYPPNSTRTPTSHSVYSLLRAGNTVYVSWITGF
jgi:hypothetical protein